MKQQTYFELWICYGKKMWHPLKRNALTLERAVHIADKIAAEHSKATKISIVKTTITKDTIDVRSGTNTFLKPSQKTNCNQCGRKRFRRNINKKTGTCITCEMKSAVNKV